MHTLSAQIAATQSANDLEELRIKYFGKNGYFTLELAKLKAIADLEKRKLQGRLLNEQKQSFEEQFAKRSLYFLETPKEVADPTLPGSKVRVGDTHPITKTIAEINAIFSKIGFYRVNYPEIEYEFFAFDSLNMPSTHPARDEFESFSLMLPPRAYCPAIHDRILIVRL